MSGNAHDLGRWVATAGLCLALIGGLIYFGLFSWFGRLPGDLRFETDRVHVYFPITSMLLLSFALSLALYAVRRLF